MQRARAFRKTGKAFALPISSANTVVTAEEDAKKRVEKLQTAAKMAEKKPKRAEEAAEMLSKKLTCDEENQL